MTECGLQIAVNANLLITYVPIAPKTILLSILPIIRAAALVLMSTEGGKRCA